MENVVLRVKEKRFIKKEKLLKDFLNLYGFCGGCFDPWLDLEIYLDFYEDNEKDYATYCYRIAVFVVATTPNTMFKRFDELNYDDTQAMVKYFTWLILRFYTKTEIDFDV